jgi:hypothetical protein
MKERGGVVFVFGTGVRGGVLGSAAWTASGSSTSSCAAASTDAAPGVSDWGVRARGAKEAVLAAMDNADPSEEGAFFQPGVLPVQPAAQSKHVSPR